MHYIRCLYIHYCSGDEREFYMNKRKKILTRNMYLFGRRTYLHCFFIPLFAHLFSRHTFKMLIYELKCWKFKLLTVLCIHFHMYKVLNRNVIQIAKHRLHNENCSVFIVGYLVEHPASPQCVCNYLLSKEDARKNKIIEYNNVGKKQKVF